MIRSVESANKIKNEGFTMSTKKQLKLEHILILQIDTSFYQKRKYFDNKNLRRYWMFSGGH